MSDAYLASYLPYFTVDPAGGSFLQSRDRHTAPLPGHAAVVDGLRGSDRDSRLRSADSVRATGVGATAVESGSVPGVRLE